LFSVTSSGTGVWRGMTNENEYISSAIFVHILNLIAQKLDKILSGCNLGNFSLQCALFNTLTSSFMTSAHEIGLQ
jgi:hypothetical protein